MIIKTINLGTCKVSHDISIPSKLSDYDYDPHRPNRRFISTYLHKIIFSDPITGADLVYVSFDSTTCADIISILYQILFRKYMNDSITIRNVYIGTSSKKGVIILTTYGNIIKFTICDFITPSVTFDIVDIKLIIDILDIDIMEDMFIINSDEY